MWIPFELRLTVNTERTILFLAVRFADAWNTSKNLLTAYHSVAENHDQTPNDTQVAKEKGEVKNETITKSLYDHHAQEPAHGDFCVAL